LFLAFGSHLLKQCDQCQDVDLAFARHSRSTSPGPTTADNCNIILSYTCYT
jgi:hypothetical protein